MSASLAMRDMREEPTLRVLEVQPARATTAMWLRTLLAPAIAATRMTRPPPTLLEPTGRWSGWCGDTDSAPDRQITVSSRAKFWTRESVIATWLHEVAHRLLSEIPGGHRLGSDHSPAFAALQWALFARCDLAEPPVTVARLWRKTQLYDLQDLPSEVLALQDQDDGYGRALAWAIATGDAVAELDCTAEDAAREVARRYTSWLAELKVEPARREQDAAAARSAAEHTRQLGAALAASRGMVRELRWWLVSAGAAAIIEAVMIAKLAIEVLKW